MSISGGERHEGTPVTIGALRCWPGHSSAAVLGRRGSGSVYSEVYQRQENGEGDWAYWAKRSSGPAAVAKINK
jgi:hypothetical protein